ncbi:MAG TPA: serine hydrolase domain-containing protein [Clostridia bacterium]|nr:serine hydrolase domain-containing protein [Clostridia bacterium]
MLGSASRLAFCSPAWLSFSVSLGYANLEHRVAVTPVTKFRIGSITKQFTASAILRLQERGSLRVTDKLTRFFPDYPRGDEVTLHHLLTHTSGIHDFANKPDFLATITLPATPEGKIKSFMNDPFDFAPGENWSYCNTCE